MIRSFRDKGLKELFEKGRSAKVPSDLAGRVRRRLDVLNHARTLREMDIPGYKLHRLKGDRAGRYAISVNGPWRITFEWDDCDAIGVDLEQYH